MNKIFTPIILITFSFLFSKNLNAQIIYTIAGNGTAGYSGDGGLATLGQINTSNGISVDAAGNVYFTDPNTNHVRKINTSGILSTVAGNGSGTFSGDGGLATNAALWIPLTSTPDASGNLFICDSYNGRVRKVSTSGIISTVVGSSSGGFSGDGGPAINAELSTGVQQVAFDASGNMYINDTGNGRIRKVNTAGIITTIAGNGTFGFSGDGGPAINAAFNSANGIALDASGNLYISDYQNHRIRKVNTSGIISTIAGTGTPSFSGDGGPATSAAIYWPTNVSFDTFGNLYFSDTGNGRIRKINTAGIISTYVGGAGTGFSGDGGPPNLAKINGPFGVTVDALSNIYFNDALNYRIREICSGICLAGISELSTINGQLTIYPNPTSQSLHIESENKLFEDSEIEISTSLGQTVLKLPYSNTVDVSKLPEGFYYLKIVNQNRQTYFSKFIKE